MNLRTTCCPLGPRNRSEAGLKTGNKRPETLWPLPKRGCRFGWLFITRNRSFFFFAFSGTRTFVFIRISFNCVRSVFIFHCKSRCLKRYKGLGWQLALTGSSGPSPGSWNRRRLALAFKIFDGNVVKLLHFKDLKAVESLLRFESIEPRDRPCLNLREGGAFISESMIKTTASELRMADRIVKKHDLRSRMDQTTRSALLNSAWLGMPGLEVKSRDLGGGVLYPRSLLAGGHVLPDAAAGHRQVGASQIPQHVVKTLKGCGGTIEIKLRTKAGCKLVFVFVIVFVMILKQAHPTTGVAPKFKLWYGRCKVIRSLEVLGSCLPSFELRTRSKSYRVN